MSSPRKFDHDLAREMYADGVPPADLARFFGVSIQAMSHVLDPEKYKRRLARERASRRAS